MLEAVVSAKGQVVIPQEFREKLGIRAGTRVRFFDEGGRLALAPITRESISLARGALKHVPRLVEALLKERAWEKDR
jgi:AbrB family looped-hinge helix DNA binding protein